MAPDFNDERLLQQTAGLLRPDVIAFGPGARHVLGEVVGRYARRAFVIAGSRTLIRSGALGELTATIGRAGVRVVTLPAARREPATADVDAAVGALRRYAPRPGDAVVGIGGGAALDLAKAVAAMAAQPRGSRVADYLETGGSPPPPLPFAPLPLIAVPTTAGTGSEATRNAVVTVEATQVKRSLRDNRLMPTAAVVDPELTLTCRLPQLAEAGLDALGQLLESFVALKATPQTKQLCRECLQGLADHLRTAARQPGDVASRTALARAALVSGIVLTAAGLGVAHAVAAPLGAMYGVPHGRAVGALLPFAARLNAASRPEDFNELQSLLFPAAPQQPLAVSLHGLAVELGVDPCLSAHGVRAEDLPALAAASRGNSLSGNPRELTVAELQAALETVL